MTRRALIAAVGLAAAWTTAVRAQPAGGVDVDPDFLRRWERSQRERPVHIGWSSRLPPVEEPGTPLVVHGRMFDDTGRHPLERALVFAYQTDQDGLYDRAGGDGWRLRGWARTGGDGRFELHTITPGHYPNRNVAAHIHLGVDGQPGERQTLLDVLFAGDPRLSAAECARSAHEGAFGNIRPVTVTDGVAHLSIDLRLTGEFVF